MPFTAVILPTTQVDEIFDWLDENVAPAYCYNGTSLFTRELSFSFDNKLDQTLFLLRWA